MDNTTIGLLIAAGIILFGVASFYFEHIRAKKKQQG